MSFRLQTGNSTPQGSSSQDHVTTHFGPPFQWCCMYRNQKAIGRLRPSRAHGGSVWQAQLLNRRFGRSRCAAATERIGRHVRRRYGKEGVVRGVDGREPARRCHRIGRAWQAEGVVKHASTPALHGECVERAGDEPVRPGEDTRPAIGADGRAVRNPCCHSPLMLPPRAAPAPAHARRPAVDARPRVHHTKGIGARRCRSACTIALAMATRRQREEERPLRACPVATSSTEREPSRVWLWRCSAPRGRSGGS
jgi:hypothetical protein